MPEHAGPAAPPVTPAPPEPGHAERARTLVYVGRRGALATLSRRRPGHPFGSVMPYAGDERGRPLLLISAMAMHTQNLEADPRASLLVTPLGSEADPLAAARVTLMGEAARLGDDAAAAARARYLGRHPDAAAWVDFADFSFWRLEVAEVYFVGGFAAMGWVTKADYAAARPDPLAEAAADIAEHMNRDHRDALVLLARVVARQPADEATMVAVDRLGFTLRLRAGDHMSSARIGFPREVATAEDTRAVLVEMLRQARGRAPA